MSGAPGRRLRQAGHDDLPAGRARAARQRPSKWSGSGIVALGQAVQERMRYGGSIDDVDAEIIEPSTLDPDQKAALWLYAWSYLPPRRQRHSAEVLLQMLAVRGES